MDGIYGYQPKNERERLEYGRFLALAEENPEELFGRGEGGHVTATALIFDKSGERLLLVKHKIFGAYCAPGGHADGEKCPLATAMREAEEETGLAVAPITTEPAAFIVLPVAAHVRRGERVREHKHYVFAYLAVALSEDIAFRREESDDARFVPVSELSLWVTEPHMLQLYQQCLEFKESVIADKARAFAALPTRLVPWFLKNQRDLPWRKNRTPYRVWLSEIMLQQTRVEAVKEYFTRFLAAAPDVFALAAMSEEKLMKLWEGLGYYTRMRNLSKTAKEVAEYRGGVFPEDEEGLKSLSGIGDYTAGAIASIAFSKKCAAVDGNVIRVVSRLTEDFLSAQAETYRKDLKYRLEAIYPDGKESDFTESLMELGATVCLPNGEPLCGCCPLEDLCLARLCGSAALLPVRAEKPAKKTVPLTVFLIQRRDGAYAIRKRGENGVLRGMWEFPSAQGILTEREAKEALAAEGFCDVEISSPISARHVFTHLVWEMTVYHGIAAEFPTSVRAADRAMLDLEVSLPSAFKKLLG